MQLGHSSEHKRPKGFFVKRPGKRLPARRSHVQMHEGSRFFFRILTVQTNGGQSFDNQQIQGHRPHESTTEENLSELCKQIHNRKALATRTWYSLVSLIQEE
jgi:hypothetical protein